MVATTIKKANAEKERLRKILTDVRTVLEKASVLEHKQNELQKTKNDSSTLLSKLLILTGEIEKLQTIHFVTGPTNSYTPGVTTNKHLTELLGKSDFSETHVTYIEGGTKISILTKETMHGHLYKCRCGYEMISATQSEVYNENDDDEHSLKWYRWGNFFTNYFKPPRGIGKFHHFRFTIVVFARETLDQPEKRLALLKESTNVPELLTTLPEVIQPAGLTEKRMRYLYNEVRPFFQYNFRDEFCPRASEE
ncbi:unnamed protein product [Mytilus edulis]|uniref:Uncharacterized protein n=1 Tax=Mytilus edulis TaxID=6550 RepID=A0A8S3QG27_MYTED|nr:unnamed protein product [Mytilus edulis]